MAPGITHITSVAQLEKLLTSAGSNLTVIDFHATWCGPCHAIAPKFEALSKEFTSVQFLKCDVDAATDVARKYTVSAMPTFVFIKNSQKIDQVRGADPRSLEATIRKHAGSSGSSTGVFSGKGQTLGGGPAPAVGVENVAKDIKAAIDPQMTLFVAFLGLYLLYWYFK